MFVNVQWLYVFVFDVRCCDLVRKFEGAHTGLKVVADCCTVENAADSAVKLISEFLLKVCLCCLLHSLVIFFFI